MLPDVTFNSLQMYVCKDMRHYSLHSYVYPYEPIGDLIVCNNNDNGHKDDLTGYNYWITRLGQFDFAKTGKWYLYGARLMYKNIEDR